ncbi:SAF domain-containing protein [Modestobacter altitudinis]|uniref:SAF domain-containing protein n=1 Tax=Modestobacter altitudinis TaxID=2213158 RepID=UPI001FE66A04|nr:SAF domain-containing protein [Modestobacter altitudinis]
MLVVLLGGLLALAAGQMLTAHNEVLAVARDVQVGSTITADDLTTASVSADPSLLPIPAEELSEVVGLVAQVPLSRGELLTQAQVSTGNGLAAGELLVALPLRDGQFPARGLTPGQPILIVPTPGPTAATTDGGPEAGPARSIEATVAEVGQSNPTTQVTVVDVRLPADDGPTVARLASTGALAVVLLPSAG